MKELKSWDLQGKILSMFIQYTHPVCRYAKLEIISKLNLK